MIRFFDSKLPSQKTHFRIFLFPDLPPGINSLVSLLMQALFSWTWIPSVDSLFMLGLFPMRI